MFWKRRSSVAFFGTLVGFAVTVTSLTAGQSAPDPRIRMEFDVRVPMRDGTELSADVYRPDREGTFPVILVRTPYNNNSDGSVDTGKFFAEYGYAVVLQDVRGRWDSDGSFHAFVNESRDGYDTHEWAGTQPWSNGKVGHARRLLRRAYPASAVFSRELVSPGDGSHRDHLGCLQQLDVQ